MKNFQSIISITNVIAFIATLTIVAFPFMYIYDVTAQNIFLFLSFSMVTISVLAVTYKLKNVLKISEFTISISIIASPVIVAFLAFLPNINAYLYETMTLPIVNWLHKADSSIIWRNSSNDKIILMSVILFFVLLFISTFLIEKFIYKNKK